MRTLLERLRWWGAGQTIADEAADTIERQAAEIAELKEWREDARRYIERQAALLKMAKERLEAHCGGKCNAEYNPCWDRNVINEIEEYEREST